LTIFIKVKPLAAIDDLTILVSCGAVENRGSRIEKKPNHGILPGRSFAGAKQAAEKGLNWGGIFQKHPSGAKEAAEKG
jgi:hypothetical protein